MGRSLRIDLHPLADDELETVARLALEAPPAPRLLAWLLADAEGRPELVLSRLRAAAELKALVRGPTAVKPVEVE